MAVKQSTAYCNVCQEQRLFQKEGINHILHLILTIITFGLWGIAWIIMAMSAGSKKMRCTACGSTLGPGAVGPTVPVRSEHP